MNCANQGRNCPSCLAATRSSLLGIWTAIRNPRVEWAFYALLAVAVGCVMWGR
jgi:hypothetical protein